MNEDHPLLIGDLPDLYNGLVNQLWDDDNGDHVEEVLPHGIPIP